MSTPIATLLERASTALPPQKPSRASWAGFYPVVQTLMKNGHNITTAVDWMVQQGGIEMGKRKLAYRSLLTLHNRRNPKPKTK